jgi:hypothetical protein
MIQSDVQVNVQMCVDRLVQILREAIELHAQLVLCIQTQQQALRTANTTELAKCLSTERDLVNAIDAMEQRRKVVTAALATKLDVTSDGEITLSQLVAVLDDESGDRIAELGTQLRESLETAQREGGVLRESCTALLGHVGGLMQTIQVGLSQTKTYGRDGRVGRVARLSDRVDVRS